jgi:hypothetical protein
MAHKAVLTIEKQEYHVTECEYEFEQQVNGNGIPIKKPEGNFIQFRIESPDDNDLFLHEWMQNATEKKDGKFLFTVVDAGNESKKTVTFKDAYCIKLYEYFDNNNEEQMYTKITISAPEISFGDEEAEQVTFGNDDKE